MRGGAEKVPKALRTGAWKAVRGKEFLRHHLLHQPDALDVDKFLLPV